MASACEWKERLWVYAMGGGQTLCEPTRAKSTELTVQKWEPALGGTSYWTYHWGHALSPEGLSEPRRPAASPAQCLKGFTEQKGQGDSGHP